MWDFIGELIYLVTSIWRADDEISDSSPMTAGSKFDRESRRFTARLCGGAIIVLLVLGFLWWWLAK